MNPDEKNDTQTAENPGDTPTAPQVALPFDLSREFRAPEGPKQARRGVKASQIKDGPRRGPGRPRKDGRKGAPPPSAPETLPEWTPPGQEAPTPAPESADGVIPDAHATVEASDLDKNAYRCAKATVTVYCLGLMIWLGEDFEISDSERADLTGSGQDFFRLYPSLTLFPFFALFLEFAAHFARLLQKPAVRARFFAAMRWIRGEKPLTPPSNAA